MVELKLRNLMNKTSVGSTTGSPKEVVEGAIVKKEMSKEEREKLKKTFFTLLKILKEGTDPAERRGAAAVIGEIFEKGIDEPIKMLGISALENALNDEDFSVRKSIVSSLKKIESPCVLHPLLYALAVKNAISLRKEVISWIVEKKMKETTPILEEILKNERDKERMERQIEVENAIEEAIKELSEVS